MIVKPSILHIYYVKKNLNTEIKAHCTEDVTLVGSEQSCTGY